MKLISKALIPAFLLQLPQAHGDPIVLRQGSPDCQIAPNDLQAHGTVEPNPVLYGTHAFRITEPVAAAVGISQDIQSNNGVSGEFLRELIDQRDAMIAAELFAKARP